MYIFLFCNLGARAHTFQQMSGFVRKKPPDYVEHQAHYTRRDEKMVAFVDLPMYASIEQVDFRPEIH